MANLSTRVLRARLDRRCLIIFASGVVCFLMANCAMPDLGVFQGDAPLRRPAARDGVFTLVRSTPLMLRWRPAPENAEGAVSTYRVYYRPYISTLMDDGRWVLLREVPASADPAITVNAGEMLDGVYEFAVSAVGPGGESPLHRSTDATASPSTGWYLRLQTEK